jgi:hypothetical protein
MTPSTAINAIERDGVVPSGPGDVFSGWGIIGLPFQSGHVLALRRHSLSSLGPAYTSIWHRDPLDRWTFYSTVTPDRSCARYFGARIYRNVLTPIDLEWITPWTLQARAGLDLAWQVTLRSSPMTRLLTALIRPMPERAWRLPAVRRCFGLAAEAAFATGRLNLAGRTPNGHRFLIHARQLWLVDTSTARAGGHDLGPTGPLPAQAALEDLKLPQRGLAAVTSLRLERPPRARIPVATHGSPCNARAFPDANKGA